MKERIPHLNILLNITFVNGVFVAYGKKTFHNIFKFPDIARPVMFHKKITSLGRESFHVTVMFFVEDLHIVICYFQYVTASIMKRQQIELNDRQPEKQIGTNFSVFKDLFCIAARGSDYTNINIDT